MRLLAIVAGASLLAGCFISKDDLIAPADADYPIADGAHFAVYKLDAGGKRTGDAPKHITITRKGADYLYVLDHEKPAPGLMDDIGGGNYIAMAHHLDKPHESIYVLFHRTDGNWLRYAPNCSDFARLAAAHGKSRADFHITASGNNCAFSSYEDLKKAMALHIQYAAPDAEYVAE
jgi:hypothetical protein